MTSATGFIAPFFFEQFRYPNGQPLGGGYIESYVSETMIPKRLFSDVYLQIPHTNPMYLDASGFVPEYYMEEGLYTLVLKSAEGLTIATRDNVRGSVGSGQNLTGNYLPLVGGTMTGTIVSEANIVMGSDNSGADIANGPILIVGDGNTTSGAQNTAIFGFGNTVNDATYSNILGGSVNIISGDTYQSSIVAGYNNKIGSESTKSVIVGGGSNVMNAGNNSTLLGGFRNTIDNTSFTSIVGGSNNVISGGGSNSSIVGGSGNINSGGQRTVLLGGTGLQSFYNDQVILGRYNYDSNQAFQIGNGTSDGARSNAFTVSQAGDVNATSYAGTTIQIGSVSNTEFQRLDGVSANIQSQLSTLSASSHTHSNKELLDLINQSLNTSADVQFDTLSANVINGGSSNVIETNYATILGKPYKTVTMPDGRLWMAENLAWNGSGRSCTYGRLYRYEDISGVDFGNWRLPTPDEWSDMIALIQPWGVGAYVGRSPSGYELQSETGWSTADGTDVYGFAAKGSGYFATFAGALTGELDYTLFWGGLLDGTNYTDYPYGAPDVPSVFQLAYNTPYLYRGGAWPVYEGYLFAVRLIYDPITLDVPKRVLFGNNLISQADGQLLLGQYNDNNPSNIIEIGAGTSELDRHNVFSIDTDGNVSAVSLNLSGTPSNTTNALYNTAGTLYWDGSVISTNDNQRYATTIDIAASYGQIFTITHNLGYIRPNINITYGVTGEMILIDPTFISENQLSFVINSKKVMNNVNVEVSF